MDPITNPGYRYATQRYDLDGSTIDFEFNFADGYISQDYVRCFYRSVDRVETEIPRADITFVGPNQVRVSTAASQPATIEMIVIRRMTPKDAPLVDFTDDAIVNERNLDKNARQAIHCIAEMVDYFADILDIFYELNNQIIDALDEMNLLIAIINDLLENFNFLQLHDTPNSYAGHAEKVVSVNTAENGLVFRDLGDIVYEGGGRSSFSLSASEYTESITNPDYINMSLNDTAQSYAGTRDFVATVVGTETALNLRPASRAPFGIKELMRPSMLPSWPITETPYIDIDQSEMITTDGTRVVVPSARYILTESATNYIEMEKATGTITVNTTGFTAGTHHPLYSAVVLPGGEFDVLDHRTGGFDFNISAFNELSDTPSDYTGQSGKLVAVKATEDGVEFVDPATAGVNEFTDLVDTPADYLGHAGKVVAVKATEDGLEFVPSGGGGGLPYFMSSGLNPDGIWINDPTGTSTLPADGSTLNTLRATFIFGTNIDYQHRVDAGSPGPSTSGSPGDIIYGSSLNLKSYGNVIVGGEVTGRVTDSVVIGNKMILGDINQTGSNPGIISQCIMICAKDAISGGGHTQFGRSVSNNVSVSRAILIGSMPGGSTSTVAGTYDDTISIGMDVSAFGSSRIGKGSIRIGNQVNNGSLANTSNSVTIGRGSAGLRAVSAGSFNLQHRGDSAYTGSNFVSECRSHRISYARQLNNVTTPTFIYAGGVTDATVYYAQLGVSGVARVKGCVVLKDNDSADNCNIWDVVAYFKDGDTVLSQTWTRIVNDYPTVADPTFTMAGQGRLVLNGGGVASTIVYYSAIFDVEVL